MRRRSSLVVLLLLALLTVVPAHAAERLVFVSVQGLEDSEQGQAVLERLRRTRLAPHGRFDHVRAEYQLWVPERVREAQVVAAIEATRPGVHAIVGRGHGAYRPLPGYPSGADVQLLTSTGASMGPLDRLAVKGRTTIVDVFALWCAPCRRLDARLHELLARRRDIALRKLDVVSFQSPLAQEMGSSLTALPHVIVFLPDGRRVEFDGADYDTIARRLGW